MNQTQGSQHEKIQEFILELSQFAGTAEQTLEKIESDLMTNKKLFNVFSERMVAIRGAAIQLNLSDIAKIAELGEEIAIKGENAQKRSQIRKCVGSLWDALTTVKHLLVHYQDETTEEQEILIHRLEKTLEAFGGARQKIDESDIDNLFNQIGES